MITAEEYFNKRSKELGFENWTNVVVQQEWEVIELLPIEFAKLHVEAALKEAAESATAYHEPDLRGGDWYLVDKSSILNAYPLSNIK